MHMYTMYNVLYTCLPSSDQGSKLLVSIEYYLSKLCHGSFESTISTEVSPLEEEQYNTRRCSIVSKIFTLTEIILVKHTSEIGLVRWNCFSYHYYYSFCTCMSLAVHVFIVVSVTVEACIQCIV